jgi:magnesium-transporting ATPase (P-type)
VTSLITVSEWFAGLCYVDTKSLDGETNLKLKTAVSTTSSMVFPYPSHKLHVANMSYSARFGVLKTSLN